MTMAAVPSPPHAKAPPAGFTGGFGEGTCAFCHIGNDVNAYDGYVRLEGLPDTYEPGGEYVLTVELSAAETSVAGFQLTARFAERPDRGDDAGTLKPVDGRTMVSDSLGVSYLHQSEAGSATHDPDGARWSFAWSAPTAAGPVAIHVAANSGNGDESPLGDLIYTTSVTVDAVGHGATEGAGGPSAAGEPAAIDHGDPRRGGPPRD